MSRNAIALLITMMFLMVITVAIGYGLKQLKHSVKTVQSETLLYQSSAILEDIINILKKSPDIKMLKDDNSTEALYLFLTTAPSIPFEIDGLQVNLSFTSARAQFNVNEIATNKFAREYLRAYLSQNYMLSYAYVDVLLDNMSLFKAKNEYNNYNSVIFDENPNLFREYIASKSHLQKINNFYLQEYNDENIQKVPFERLFSYSKDITRAIDLNYATAEVWQLMLGVDAARAETLHAGSGSYQKIEDLGLSSEEKLRLSKFKTSFYEPYILVNIILRKAEEEAHISFEYDIRKEKGSDFVFEI